ncbi:MAG: tagaturonate reductase [Candidatus Sulfotelmatobacter sp.]
MSEPSLPALSRSLLGKLHGRGRGDVELPPAAVLSAPETILQIGSGGFLRGFVEDFVQLASENGGWAGRVVSVQRRPDRRSEALIRQNGLYTLILRGIQSGRATEQKRIIASLSRSLSAENDWDKVIAMVERPSTRVIISNVTEAGLAPGSSDSLADKPPLSFPGKLTQMLWQRWRARGPEDTDLAVIPCELVENNGAELRILIREQGHAWHLPAEFFEWLGRSIHFANTLVDRIVAGAPPPEKLESEWQRLGYRDDLIVCAEPFALFALEADEFVRKHFPIGGASAGIRFVDDLTPYRVKKVRILNGAHTVMAALGRLLGLGRVREAIEDAQLGKFIENTIFQEVIPSTAIDQEAQDAQYGRETLGRFRNPSIEHRLISICANCSTKVGIRLFPSIRNCMEQRGILPRRLLFGVAAVLLLLRDSEVEDSHLEQVREMWVQVDYRSPDSVVIFAQEILAKQMEWSSEQIDLPAAAQQVAAFLMTIREQGLRPAMESCFDRITFNG